MKIKEIKQTINEIEALSSVTQAYGEIALIKLGKIRKNTQAARLFFNEISQVYSLVKKMVPSPTPVEQNFRLKLILTSNSHFYGHIDKAIMDFFLSQYDPKKDQVLVVGRTGQELLKSYQVSAIKTMITQDYPTVEEARMIVNQMKNYSQVLVYFAQFKTVLNQIPVVYDITQESISKNHKKQEALFIFEPEAIKILEFFDYQIKMILLEQTFLEADLARTSSRLISMDQAEQNAEQTLGIQKKLLLSAKRAWENTQLLEGLQYRRTF